MDNENSELLKRMTYRDYANLLNQLSLERSFSNYFFIFINVILIAANSWVLFSSLSFASTIASSYSISLVILVYPSAFLLMIEMILNFYWFTDMRETYLVQEIRFRILMDFENDNKLDGFINEEWNRLGNLDSRKSPVFYSRLIKQLPIFFLLMHILQFASVIFIYFSR